jgi:hypothetical protein
MTGYAAFFAWWATPQIPDGAKAFSYHRGSIDSYVLGLFAFSAAIEAAIVHALVRHWSAGAAWVLTVLSGSGVLYLIGSIRAFSLRPALLDQTRLTLRLGLVRSVTVALADIRQIDRIHGTPDRAKDLKRLCLLQPANLLITTATGRIACYVDEPQALIEAILR